MKLMGSVKSRRLFLAQVLACLLPVAALAMAADDKAKTAPQAQAAPDEYEVRLIWANNEETSPDPTHKKLDSNLTSWLKKSFRWSSYYEVNKTILAIPSSQKKEAKLSDVCTIKVKNLGDSRLELELWGKGKLVSKTSEKLDKWIILAGEDKNETAWFVVIRKKPVSK